MSIYYFAKERFPRKEQLAELRLMSDGQSRIQSALLSDDHYFTDFQLNLPESTPGQPNRFHLRRYSSLDDLYQASFDLRTIRNIIVQQINPQGDDAMYEIFNRLNSGGVNLTPQEIRRCMYNSKFYDMLYLTNTKEQWRKLVGARIPDTHMPDTHMKDVEILLRGFAMLINGESYRPSMVKFLNRFSQQAKGFDDQYLEQLRLLLDSFLHSCRDLTSDAFHSTQGRFSPMIFESVFVAACGEPYIKGLIINGHIDPESLRNLKEDKEFWSATQSRTAATASVQTRLGRAREILIVGQ